MKIPSIQFDRQKFFADLFGDKVYLVGGTIRDHLLYSEVRKGKDVDLMVVDHSYDDIHRKLSGFGRVNTVGKSFAVIKFRLGGETFDISLPRRDRLKNGDSSSHRNFEVTSGPGVSLEEDLRRRDFTCNSLALNLKTGELVDPCGGLSDIREKRIRMTNPHTFADDPLRVFRCARFAARHGFTVDSVIYETAAGVKFNELSRERICEEFLQLLHSGDPARGMKEYFYLSILRKVFPELYALTLTIQDASFHPETDEQGHHTVWGHTLQTLDIANRLLGSADMFNPRETTLLLSALFHDIGKPRTTQWDYKRGRMTVTSIKHDSLGARMVPGILTDLKIDSRQGFPVRDTVERLVRNHHRIYDLYQNRSVITFKSIARLLRDLEGEDFLLLLLDLADRGSRLSCPPEDWKEDKISRWYLDKKKAFRISRETIEPLVRGRDLMKLGVKPGKAMGRFLEKLYDCQLEGSFRNLEEGLEFFQKRIRPKGLPGD